LGCNVFTIHYFWEPGILGHFRHFDSGILQHLGRPTGRENIRPKPNQPFGHCFDPGLIRNANQRFSQLCHDFPYRCDMKKVMKNRVSSLPNSLENFNESHISRKKGQI
jgi:hypothetical protein